MSPLSTVANANWWHCSSALSNYSRLSLAWLAISSPRSFSLVPFQKTEEKPLCARGLMRLPEFAHFISTWLSLSALTPTRSLCANSYPDIFVQTFSVFFLCWKIYRRKRKEDQEGVEAVKLDFKLLVGALSSWIPFDLDQHVIHLMIQINCFMKYIINLVHMTTCKVHAGLTVKSHGQKIGCFYFVNKLLTHHERETYTDSSLGGSSWLISLVRTLDKVG